MLGQCRQHYCFIIRCWSLFTPLGEQTVKQIRL